ncbi:MAG: hypothetical protein LBV74_15820 [Tannerella sp.]|jgi:hypothetical protein|nr:hypothetical protein [Tannerella sp.]
MKHLLITIMFLAASYGVFGQASVVVDVSANQSLQALDAAQVQSNITLGSVSAILQAMEKAEKLKMSADFIKGLKTVQRIYSSMEALICQIDGLRIESNRSIRSKDCFFNMQSEVASLNVTLSSDLMKLAVLATASFKTDFKAADKVNMLVEICDNLDKASVLLDELRFQLVQENISYFAQKGAKLRRDYGMQTANRYRK